MSPVNPKDLPDTLRHLADAISIDGRRIPGLTSDPYIWAEVWFDPGAACVPTSLRERIQASRGGLEPVSFRTQRLMSDALKERISPVMQGKLALGELIAWLTPLM